MVSNDWGRTFEEAAFEPSNWMHALETLASATGSLRAQLVGFGGAEATSFNWISNFDDSDARLFDQLNGHSPELNFRVAADRLSPRSVLFEDDYDTARSMLVREDYIEFCEQTRMPLGCQSMLVRGEAGLVGLALLRSHCDGRTDERVRTIFAEASAAARVAVRFQIALEQQGHALIGGALEAMVMAGILFDRSGRVCAVTPAAEAELTRPGPVRLSAGRTLDAGSRGNAQIGSALQQLIHSGERDYVRLRFDRRSSDDAAIELELFRIRRREWSLGFEPCVIGILRRAEAQAQRAQHSFFAATFGFTEAESAIASMLLQGQNRRDIAAARKVTPETVRGQIKTIFGKTGCHREAELVSLLTRVSN